ncbi:unnamed protein product [Spirodela intermedia]|uniref:Uncharacterized protein n=1 Tax=Spirodela intermedia TaxID=51605 RepID=A0A7I8JFV9_SPIIN|nr:unnamed protein product [Spirodela intermedia]CAA6669037.1 unnamed protein product [Spirodela intermedia]
MIFWNSLYLFSGVDLSLWLLDKGYLRLSCISF